MEWIRLLSKTMEKRAIKISERESRSSPADLAAQARLIRGALSAKRSDTLLRLFEFLLARSVEGRPPSEIEIASEVFSKEEGLDVSQDATVRVYVHRLRKTLDQIYSDRAGPQLSIPKGVYRIDFQGVDSGPQGGPVALPRPNKPATAAGKWFLWTALTLLVVGNVTAWWAFQLRNQRGPSSLVADTALWRPITQDNFPTIVAIGDYYLFSETTRTTDGRTGVARLIRDPTINSREDLDVYLMRHPAELDKVAGQDLHYVPSGAMMALGDIFEVIRGLKTDSGQSPGLIPMSQLTAEALKSSDIVYVGLLSGLKDILRNPVFRASGFRIGKTYEELIDTRSGRHYLSDGTVLSDDQIPRRDYGYLASLPGPSGNHILIIAGTGDPAIRQMAQLVKNREKLQQISTDVGSSAAGFEVLYQVRTMGTLNIASKLLIERPLRSAGIWDNPMASQRFPNEIYEGGEKK